MFIDFKKVEVYYKILGYTRKEFAKKIGVLYVTYTSWNSGVNPYNVKELLKKITFALNEGKTENGFKKSLLKKIKANDLLIK